MHSSKIILDPDYLVQYSSESEDETTNPMDLDETTSTTQIDMQSTEVHSHTLINESAIDTSVEITPHKKLPIKPIPKKSRGIAIKLLNKSTETATTKDKVLDDKSKNGRTSSIASSSLRKSSRSTSNPSSSSRAAYSSLSSSSTSLRSSSSSSSDKNAKRDANQAKIEPPPQLSSIVVVPDNNTVSRGTQETKNQKKSSYSRRKDDRSDISGDKKLTDLHHNSDNRKRSQCDSSSSRVTLTDSEDIHENKEEVCAF